jgi:serine/threonine-protein kinase HipA
MINHLPVFFETRPVGRVEVVETGARFVYDDTWLSLRGAFPISVTMPRRREPYGPEVILPWAANLLPESQGLQAVSQLLGRSPGDVIGILSEMGRDTAGALSIGRPGTAVVTGRWRAVERPEDLERIIEELPSKPFLAGEDGVSMSLAGGQTKLGVAWDGQRIHIPVDGAPSTHILKPDTKVLWGGVQNEAFCLTLARRIGLTVPTVTAGTAGARSYILVERYDRRHVDGRWRRLHQEDFCQAFGKPPVAKYQSNQSGIAGPSLKDMFSVPRKYMNAEETSRLLDMVIVNVICCNTAAHAKNYSLLIRSSDFSMAPLYDVMCAEVFDNVTKNMAQKIAGKSRGDHLRGRHWRRFASECGLNPKGVLRRVGQLSDAVMAESDAAMKEVEAMPGGNHPTLDRVRAAVARRALHIKQQLAEVDPEPSEEDEPAAPAPSMSMNPT